MAGHTKNKPRWGDSAAIEGLLEAQEDLEAEEAVRAAEESGVDLGGRPAFEPTDKQRELVKNMARCNMPQEAMTLMVTWPNGRPIAVNTLRKVFRDELITGHHEVGMQLVGAAYKKAMAGDTGAICFLLKTGYGFRETVHQEITGKDGAPLQTTASGVLLVPSTLAAEDWEKVVSAQQAQLLKDGAAFLEGEK